MREEERNRQEQTLRALRNAVNRVVDNANYASYLGISSADCIRSIDDFESLPFLTKEELRTNSPFGLCCADERRIVRVHSTSGTTGQPVVIPYTQGDVDTFSVMMARALAMSGVTDTDRVMVTPGYGLWTAGIGFQSGIERIGACTIPTGTIPIDRQMVFVSKMSPTVLTATASFALLLGEMLRQNGEASPFRTAILGAEQWGDKRRQAIESLLGVDTYDIYGMTETYGPGLAIDCRLHQGLHYWDDLFYFEVIDPTTGRVLPAGEQGELVVTSLVKEALPLVRYRTRDLCRLLPDTCPCGSPYPRISRVTGRSDDMITYRGVNLFPSAVESMMASVPSIGSEYRILITTSGGRDTMTIEVEAAEGAEVTTQAQDFSRRMKASLSIMPAVSVLPYGSLTRSEKKSKRVYDERIE